MDHHGAVSYTMITDVARATRAQQNTLTVCHIATASIYPGADGWYWLCVGTARQAAQRVRR
jgi:hypothetical protein